MSNKQIYELAILGRATWELHSLNNEGTVGNVTEPRTVVLADGTKTDGISGEMLKHIHAMRVWELESDKSKFCEACRVLEPSKAGKNPNVTSQKKTQKAVETALSDCILCDLHGFLIERPTVARPSTLEFGWAVGVPEVHRGIHLHARHAVGEKAKAKPSGEAENSEETKAGKESSQMIYHRPTRSGQYAVISVFRPWRIGLNHVDMTYVNNVDREARYKLALSAYGALFLNPEGAMTTTRLPHSGPIEGAVIYTTTNHPTPLISPLHDDYIQELQDLSKRIEASVVKPFGSLDEFAAVLEELEKFSPYKLS